MAFYNFVQDSINPVKTLELITIQNHITYICNSDFELSYNNKLYKLKKGDTVLAESTHDLTRYGDKLHRIINPDDIIDIFLYLGNEGYLKAPLNRNSLLPQVLTFNPVTKELEWGAGGGGGGTLSILDEGVVVNAATDTLNFIGVDVLAQQDGVAPNQVNIYIPPPAYPSHFDRNDGIGDARISDIPTSNRHISSPIAEGNPFNIGSWNGGETHPTIRNASIGYSNAGDFVIEDLTTSIVVEVIDADGVTVRATNSATNISGNSDNTTNGIRIQITNFGTSAVKYKARATFTFDMHTIFPTGGRFQIRMTHFNSTDGTWIFNQGPIFYDNDDTASTVTGMTIIENAGSVITREISGVESYTTGSQFQVDIADIDDINNYSYINWQLRMTAINFGLPAINIFETNMTGWTSVYNAVNLTYHKADWAINANNFCFRGLANGITAWQDWGLIGSINSPNQEISVNTLNDDANRIYSNFNVETLRLEDDYTTVWDNLAELGVTNGGTGLQYLCSRLVYPQINFQTTSPNAVTQPDYTLLTGRRWWYRVFWHTGTSHSNGLFALFDTNITEADLTNGDFTLEVSLDNTDWYNLDGLYGGGVLNNNDKNRINKDTHGLSGNAPNAENNEIEFTLALKNTDATTGNGWGIFIRISFSDTARGKQLYMGSFEILNWI